MLLRLKDSLISAEVTTRQEPCPPGVGKAGEFCFEPGMGLVP
jgi:hypothetical protein